MQSKVAIIPARYTSNRLSHKVLLDIGEKSMLEHVVQRVTDSKLFDAVIVATDHIDIMQLCESKDIEVYMTDENHTSGTDRVSEVVTQIDADIIVNVQADEPFISDEHLTRLCTSFDDASVMIATLSCPFSDADDLFDYNKVKVVKNIHGNALYFSRQAIPASRDLAYRAWSKAYPYEKHIGTYGFRKDTLLHLVELPVSPLEDIEKLEQLRWLENGYNIRVITVQQDTIGVDTEEDLENARRHYKKLLSNP